MPVEVILPKVDMDMTSGSIAAWHAGEGERVTKGEPLFDIETDKAAMEVESPASGHLHHISVKEGSEVAIGTTLAWIYAEGEEVGPAPSAEPQGPDDSQADENPALNAQTQELAASEVATRSSAHAAEKPRATPAARRLAATNAIDLSGISGTGPRHRIQRADIEALLETPAPTSPTPAPTTWSTQSGDLSIVTSGSGDGLPFVLIHGFAADASGWNPVEKALRRSAQVHRIELPNHGQSPRRKIDGFSDLVSQVRGAFDSRGAGPVHLVGHSLGAAVALALADTRSRAIAKLTLIAPAGLGPDINGSVLAGIANATRAESLGPWLRELTGDPDKLSETYIRAAAAQRNDPALRAAQQAMMERLFPDGVQSFSLRAALNRIDCPARIIWGKRDSIIPWTHALGAPGGVSLNLFDDVGHMPHIEIPQQVCTLLEQ
jgi:pimeloyl-ACP methyl ester carboxylesterase